MNSELLLAKLRSPWPRPLRIALRVVYWILLALIFSKAARLRFDLPRWPIADGDAWGYSHPAFSAFTGGPFQLINGRNFLYPGFLLVVLSIGKTVGSITVAQHLLGLATGALLLACWDRLRPFVRVLPRSLHSLGGLFLAAIYLLSSRPVHYEHDLRPEAITPFFAILNILLTLIFFAQRCGKPPSRAAAITGACILVNSVLLAALRTSFLLSVCFSVMPVLITLADRSESWSRRIAVLGAGLLAMIAFALPAARLAKSDPEARAFLPVSLFSIHANIILAQMDEDLARGDCGEAGCDQLREMSTTLRDDMGHSWQLSKIHGTLGFDPDFLKYDPNSMHSWPERFFAGDKDKMLAFCMRYYWRAVRHQPRAILRKIGSQLRIFYAAQNPSFTKRRTVRMAERYRDSAKFMGEGNSAAEQALVATYVDEVTKLAHSKVAITPSIAVTAVIWVFAFMYLPVLFAVLVLAIVFILLKRRRRHTFAFLVLFLFSYNFGCTLGVAIMHSLHIVRYSETQYAFSLLALCAGLLLLTEMAAQFSARALRCAF